MADMGSIVVQSVTHRKEAKMASERMMMVVGNMVAEPLSNGTLAVWQISRHGAEMRWLLLSTTDSCQVLVTKDLLGKTCRLRLTVADLVVKDIVNACAASEAWRMAEHLLVQAQAGTLQAV